MKIRRQAAISGRPTALCLGKHPLLSTVLYTALNDAGWEKRGEVVRLVQTLRGGDRPKNAEDAFPDVTVMPRSAWEPWGLFRNTLDGRVQDNLRRWGTGALRRISDQQPFTDVIASERTPQRERDLVNHPSLKPQRFMRQIVRASLPLGKGRVLDPFMGGGSTIAAAQAVDYESIGVEVDPHFFALAETGIPNLASLYARELLPIDVESCQATWRRNPSSMLTSGTKPSRARARVPSATV